MTTFLQMALDSKCDKPNYDALRSVLKTELDEYKNERGYDKFDWEIEN